MLLKRKSYSFVKNSKKVNSAECIGNVIKNINASGNITGETNEETVRRKRNPFLGIFYVFLTVATFGSFNVIVKKLSYIPTGQMAFLRNAGSFVGSLPIAIACHQKISGEKKDKIILAVRGILGATGIYLTVLTYALLPLAEAAIFLSIVPAVTFLFARIFLQERCSLVQILSLVITICGVLLSVRLPELLQEQNEYQFSNNYIAGLAAAVGCIFTLSLSYVVLRKMKDMHFTIPMIYLGIFGMIENATINGIMVSYSPPECGWDQLSYVSTVIIGFAGNLVFTLALQVEQAGIVAVLRACFDIIVSIVFQIIFFKEYPDLYNIGGGFLVILSLSILGIRNWLLSLPENSEHRKRLRFFVI